MNFSRAKTFLIIMFLAVDIFLLYSILANSTSNPFSKNDSYQKVTALLEKKSIFIEDDETVLNQNNIFSLTLKNISGDRDYFSSLILGDFTVKDNEAYASDKGEITFKNGEFNFVPASKTAISENMLSEDAAKEVLSQLKRLGFSTDRLKYTSTVEEKKGLFRISYCHVFYEKELLNSPFTVYADESGILRVMGGIYSIHSFDSENPDLKSKEEILIRFSNLKKTDEKIYISSIKEGYYNPRQEYTSFSVIPSIKITLKTGEAYYFDLTDGKLLENS